MQILEVFPYVSIGVLVLLLVAFEIMYRKESGPQSAAGGSYAYYTPDGHVVRIRHIFASRYKVYADSGAPVPVRRDRFGCYFILNARTSADAEAQIDAIYNGNRRESDE